jgi:hypothetical protein
MIGDVRAASRVLIVLLVSGIGLGSSILDGCLVVCHPAAAAKSARAGHCHTVASSTGAVHVQAVPSCCHDDSSKPSEPGGNRVTSVAQPQIVVAVMPRSDDGAVNFARLDLLRLFTTAPQLSPNPSPLRV